MIEAMKLAYADRAEYLGDSDAVDVPIERLTSKAYAASCAPASTRSRRGSSVDIRAGEAPASSGGNTTHVSIVDHDGNAVANTTRSTSTTASASSAGQTGILLNNTLDDFAAKPGAPNAFGLTGGAANAPGPNKRPLSSMTPTIVLKDGAPAFVTGAPGGSRIITSVLQVLVNAIDFKKPIAEAVAAPRVHHQWLPDEVVVERTLPAETVRALVRARPQGAGRPDRRAPRTRSRSRPPDWWAPPTRAPRARWRRDTELGGHDRRVGEGGKSEALERRRVGKHEQTTHRPIARGRAVQRDFSAFECGESARHSRATPW